MSSYDLTNYMQMKPDNFYDSLEQEIALELQKHLNACKGFENKLESLKTRVEILSSLDRIFSLYSETSEEVQNLKQSLLIQVCDIQLQLRFLQEKELLLKGYFKSIEPVEVPSIRDLNKEYLIRKKQVECDLLARYLLEENGFEEYKEEIAKANEALDRAIDLGDIKELADCTAMYHQIFEQIINDVELKTKDQERFRIFREEIRAQARQIPLFMQNEATNHEAFSHLYTHIQKQRFQLEKQVEKAMYHFAKLSDGRKSILNEIKNDRNSIEAMIYKIFHEKEIIHQLQICKSELTAQKNHYLNAGAYDRDLVTSEYENLDKKFKKIVARNSFEKHNLLERLFLAPKNKPQRSYIQNEKSLYNKVLTQVLNNDNIPLRDKQIIIRLARDSSLINTHTGKFFFQRSGKANTRYLLDDLKLRYLTKEVSTLRH